jgi:acetyl-CoA carboxylase biotin carboxyl carrier protein
MTMVYNTIKKLIGILNEEGIDEIEVRRFWTTVRVARRTRSNPASQPSVVEPGEVAPQPVAVPDPAASETRADDLLQTFASPMVGTFYRAPNPESKPFVYEGKRIERGEVLCIIEAMKLMNEIEADKGGVVKKILVQDSEPVEFGQPLFLIESA